MQNTICYSVLPTQQNIHTFQNNEGFGFNKGGINQNCVDLNNQQSNEIDTAYMLTSIVKYIYGSFCFCNEKTSNNVSRKFHKDGEISKRKSKVPKMMPNEITFGNSLSEKSLMSTGDYTCSQLSTALSYVSKANNNGVLKLQDQESGQQKYSNFEYCSEGSSDKPKRDMINYEALEGHPYKIIDNPDRENVKGAKLYIGGYEGGNKTFSKTWNLVYHFRTHQNNKPYHGETCGREFAQKSNFQRHLAVHNNVPLKERKIFNCPKCSRSYSNKYNLNVSIKN